MAQPRPCPHCGSTDPDRRESNGGTQWGGDLTWLCTAPVAPGEESFDILHLDPEYIGVCGYQWDDDEWPWADDEE